MPGATTGELELRIGISGGKSVATRQFHAGALKVVRPHYLDDSGQVYYITANPGGGYVGGDAYRIEVDVEEGASVLLTDQSATKVYRTPGTCVTQRVALRASAGGVLEYVPNQLILYRDADFRQAVRVDLDPTASVFLTDVVTPGWSPDGAQFRYRQARLRTEVRVAGRLALVDNLRIAPGEDIEMMRAPAFLGGRTHFATAICFDPEVDEALVREVRDAVRAVGGIEASVSACDEPGFVVRAVGDRTEELMRAVHAAGNVVRRRTRGQGPIGLRQY